MGWFILERKDTNQIVCKEEIDSLYTRVLVKDFEWGVQVKQGITTLLPSGTLTSIVRPPWVSIVVYLGSSGDFFVPFNVSPYLSSFRVTVQGAIYAKVTKPVNLVRNIDNLTNNAIYERVKHALEMSLIQVISHLQIPEIQQATFQQPSNFAANIMSEMGLTARYVTLSNVNIPEAVENALHNLAASIPERDRIRNLAYVLGKNTPMVNQQILQWENRGAISDLLNLLLLANVSGQSTALVTPPASQVQVQQSQQQPFQQPPQPQQAIGALPLVPVPADNNVCPVCNGIMDGKTRVLQCPRCKATFHEACARMYAAKSGRCPICRGAIRVE